MRLGFALVTTWALLACTPTRAVRPEPQGAAARAAAGAPTAATVDSLLTWAAADFRAHGSPPPARFRAVRSGSVVTPSGTRQHRVCGEYSPAAAGATAEDRAEWIAFATIQTAPYEQWVGAQAAPHCRDATVRWDGGDLSSRLLDRFRAGQ